MATQGLKPQVTKKIKPGKELGNNQSTIRLNKVLTEFPAPSVGELLFCQIKISPG
jgi:hypothetical protein